MVVDILFSGSRGNCTLIRHGSSAVLIDCGKSARAVTKALSELGVSPCDISAVFITHEHSDHVSALEIFCSGAGIPIHITARSAERFPKDSRAYPLMVIHDAEYSETVGTLTVKSFPLPHDSRCHVGYVISDTDGDVFGIATDMGYVTEQARCALSSCSRVVIEANHDVDMLKSGRYPAELKRRILSKKGHLSNEECGSFVCELAGEGCKCFALAHLSPENNDPEVAYTDVRRALDMSGYTGAKLVVTDRNLTVHLPPCGAEEIC